VGVACAALDFLFLFEQALDLGSASLSSGSPHRFLLARPPPATDGTTLRG
jgi:hypothetical protein